MVKQESGGRTSSGMTRAVLKLCERGVDMTYGVVPGLGFIFRAHF